MCRMKIREQRLWIRIHFLLVICGQNMLPLSPSTLSTKLQLVAVLFTPLGVRSNYLVVIGYFACHYIMV